MKRTGWKILLLNMMVCVSVLLWIPSVLAQQEEQQAEAPVLPKVTFLEKLEFEVHYGQWTLDPIKGAFEDELFTKLGKEIRKEMSSQIRDSHPSLVQSSYEESLSFDSGGSNYGVEARFYPQGRAGSFSLGFSLEKTKMRLTIKGPVKQEYTDGSYADVTSEGYVLVNPFSTNLSFRWDMRPAWRVTPYIVFGFGLAAMSGEVTYTYSGTYNWGGSQEKVQEAKVKTLKEAEEDIEFNIPNIFILVQANLGLRAEIIPNLHLRIEAGIWDGLILRGGLAFRF